MPEKEKATTNALPDRTEEALFFARTVLVYGGLPTLADVNRNPCPLAAKNWANKSMVRSWLPIATIVFSIS
jgi:hypothetical protein